MRGRRLIGWGALSVALVLAAFASLAALCIALAGVVVYVCGAAVRRAAHRDPYEATRAHARALIAEAIAADAVDRAMILSVDKYTGNTDAAERATVDGPIVGRTVDVVIVDDPIRWN
jgi:hypothetical protein